MARAIRATEYVVVTADEETRFFAETLLEETGMSVRSFDSPGACLTYLDQNAPQVAMVFADLSAGETESTRLVTTIGERWPWVHLVSTGTPDQLNAAPADSQRMPKPWRPIELLIAAERARMHAAS